METIRRVKSSKSLTGREERQKSGVVLGVRSFILACLAAIALGTAAQASGRVGAPGRLLLAEDGRLGPIQLSFGGTGCPGGQPVVMELGQGFLRVEFADFEVEAVGAKRVDRKACSVTIRGAHQVDSIRVLGLRDQDPGALSWLSAESFALGSEGDRMDRFYREAGLHEIDEVSEQAAYLEDVESGLLRLHFTLGARVLERNSSAHARIQAIEFRLENRY